MKLLPNPTPAKIAAMLCGAVWGLAAAVTGLPPIGIAATMLLIYLAAFGLIRILGVP